MARRESGYIEVDGWKEFQRAARRSADQDLPKRLGQANKRTGQFIKDLVEAESRPEAVGLGSGSEVRPSASKREVLWRVGGSHRGHANPKVVKMRQWGKKVVQPFRPAPARPYMKQIADRNRPQIERFFLEAVSEAVEPAFAETDP